MCGRYLCVAEHSHELGMTPLTFSYHARGDIWFPQETSKVVLVIPAERGLDKDPAAML